MSFTGDLEHLPIVDVIQLLHSARKSGTLSVKSRKGESQLVLRDGYIVSANHLNNSVRIGHILVERHGINAGVIDQALMEQNEAGENRKPLIGMLIESGRIRKEEAFKGLEFLIEMTVVEMLTWTRGTFTLNVESIAISDEFRYFPEKLHQEISIDTQMVLMDALRIFDEKKRDGELLEEDSRGEEEAATSGGDGGWGHDSVISAEDLGLADLDKLERKIPEVFTPLEAFDPAEIHRQKIRETLSGLPLEEQEKLVHFLMEASFPADAGDPSAKHGGTVRGVILYSRDELLRHAVTTLCNGEGILVFAKEEPEWLDQVIEQTHAREIAPILVLDAPGEAESEFSREHLTAVRRRQKMANSRLSMIQLAPAGDGPFWLQSFDDGVRTLLTRPRIGDGKEGFVEAFLSFLRNLQSVIRGGFREQDGQSLLLVKKHLPALRRIRGAPEMAFDLLRRVALYFERSVTLVVRKTELMAERGFGIRQDKSLGPTPPLKFTVPLEDESVFRRVMEGRNLFYGESNDRVLTEHLFGAIGAPLRSRILLLPMRRNGETVTLTYGDFGAGEVSAAPVDALEMLAEYASLLLENANFRKKLERTSSLG